MDALNVCSSVIDGEQETLLASLDFTADFPNKAVAGGSFYGAKTYGPWPTRVRIVGTVGVDDDLYINGTLAPGETNVDFAGDVAVDLWVEAGQTVAFNIRNSAIFGGPCFATGTLSVVGYVPLTRPVPPFVRICGGQACVGDTTRVPPPPPPPPPPPTPTDCCASFPETAQLVSIASSWSYEVNAEVVLEELYGDAASCVRYGYEYGENHYAYVEVEYYKESSFAPCKRVIAIYLEVYGGDCGYFINYIDDDGEESISQGDLYGETECFTSEPSISYTIT